MITSSITRKLIPFCFHRNESDTLALASNPFLGLEHTPAGDKLAFAMIPEIDIWRAASLMLKRYGEKALEESAARADELFAEQDHDGAAVGRRIIVAIGQLANTTPSGQLH
jgi:hypothetical protein